MVKKPVKREYYGFTSKELDEETGLYYFGARYYDAQISKWISPDPIYDGLKEGLSIYGYARNNPLIYHDPSGLKAKKNGDSFWKKIGRGLKNHFKNVQEGRKKEQERLDAIEKQKTKNEAEYIVVYGFKIDKNDPEYEEKLNQTIADLEFAEVYGTLTGLCLIGIVTSINGLLSRLSNGAGNFTGRKSLGAAASNTRSGLKGLLKDAKLPTTGKIRYVPPKNVNVNTGLPRAQGGGFIDKFGNVWTRGSSRTAGQAFEWDIQLSNTGKAQLGWLSKDGAHVNVSLDGDVTH